jgi:hypothetical protein
VQRVRHLPDQRLVPPAGPAPPGPWAAHEPRPAAARPAATPPAHPPTAASALPGSNRTAGFSLSPGQTSLLATTISGARN